MLVAACLAIVPGAAATSALGAVHSMSHPAGAHNGVPHGVANSINLPHVIRFNCAGGPEVADRYRDIAELLGAEAGGSDDGGGGVTGELGHRADHPDRATAAPLRGGGP